jgi:RNA polymerase sigma factor (sigma-70 family)
MIHLDQVIEGCKKQKADCQKQLYQLYFGLMMSICNRYANNTQDAEEMLNNGFLKIFKKIEQYTGNGNFEGWMRKIMANVCLDYIKLKQNRDYNFNTLLPNIENNDTFLDNLFYEKGLYYESKLDEDCKQQLISDTLKELAPLTKTIVNLHIFEEYSHKEIAELLKIAERTSQWHINIAKKALIEKLTKNKLNNVAGI